MSIPENAVVRICVNADRQAELPLMLQQRAGKGQCVECELPVIFDRLSLALSRKACRLEGRPHLLLCEQCASRLRFSTVVSHEYSEEFTAKALSQAIEERN